MNSQLPQTIDLAAVCVGLRARGFSVRDIVEMTGVSQRTTYRYLERGREQGLLNGRVPKSWEFSPRLDCRCETDPIKLGALLVCVGCCSCGWDFHPAMHAEPLPKDPPKKYQPSPGLRGGV
jgi:hypothetical protein